MTIDADDGDLGVNETIHFNGINADGSYLVEPMSTADLARAIRGPLKPQIAKADLAELKSVENGSTPHFGVKEGVDATNLGQAGWGVIFPFFVKGSDEEREQDRIYHALEPLLRLRKRQATSGNRNRYQEYRGEKKGYRRGDTKQGYLGRLGVGAGAVDPNVVPYYLLIVASPNDIPFEIQYQIDVQYAVGRLHFDTVEEYANYARSVEAAEESGLVLEREVAFVGVANDGDEATQGTLKNLVRPLAVVAQSVPGWKVSGYFGDDAKKEKVKQLFGGCKTPALLFTGSHGVCFPEAHEEQALHQGALLLQDWKRPDSGQVRIDRKFFLSGDDLRGAGSMLGMIAFNFACFGAGTPELDAFPEKASDKGAPGRGRIAKQAFISGLHRKMLGHPSGGALAAIGHVERVWDCSFMWRSSGKRTRRAAIVDFESTLIALMAGKPVGLAMDYFNLRYSELTSDLHDVLDSRRRQQNFNAEEDRALALMWTSSNDARGYVVTGDPAVRLPVANGVPPLNAHPRESIDLSSFGRPPAAATAESRTPVAPAPIATDPASEHAIASHDRLFGAFLDDGKARPEPVSAGEARSEPVKADEAKPNLVQDFVNKVVVTLSKAVVDATSIEVRTYVATDARAAASADRERLTKEGDLRAFTRITIDGDMDVIIPERDGVVDTALWNLHLEMVKQAQAGRADTIKAVLASLSHLIKL
jgi:hypothetical protein